MKHTHALLARICNFPPQGDNIPVRLEVKASGGREVWTRYFGDAILRTVQWMSGDLLVEAIGPVRVYYHVLASEAGMCFNSARARCWGVPLPLRIQAVVRGGDSSWEFEVDVAGIGSYRGVMNLLP